MTYHPPPYPTPGRFVFFNHAEDVWAWPAIILQVRVRDSNNEVMGSIVSGGRFIADDRVLAGLISLPEDPTKFRMWDPLIDELPVDWTIDCQLQVFRPRANEWRWASEGVLIGTWSWPNAQIDPAYLPLTSPKEN